jgi:hypothetical protein
MLGLTHDLKVRYPFAHVTDRARIRRIKATNRQVVARVERARFYLGLDASVF